jgi:ABC-type multidrug transport system ATPase subunit
LILDEPTTGVDAVSRKEFWDMLMKLKQEGITLLVSTPYMDEARLCDRVALIQHGKVLKIDPPGKILTDYPGTIWVAQAGRQYPLLLDMRDYEGITAVYPFGDYIHFTPKSDPFDPAGLKQFLESRGHHDPEILQSEPTIEDCFMELMTQ